MPMTQLPSPCAGVAMRIFGILHSPLRKPTIDILSMSDILHENVPGLRIYLIHDGVISDPQAIQPLGTLQRCRLCWERSRRQALYPYNNADH
jgi:hypothetical protein